MSDRTHELTSIEREALHWYLRIRDTEMPIADWHLWRQWYAVEAHREAYFAVAVNWERFHRAWQSRATEEQAPSGRHRRSTLLMWRAVAGVAFVALIALLLWSAGAPWRREAIHAEAWTTRTLTDGSVVTLGRDTHLRTDFKPHARIVHLFSGEAIFDVAKDAHRPFTVRTTLVEARAVGTQFRISVRKEGTVVVVTQGVVAVQTHTAHGSATPLLLRAGDRIRVSSNGAEVAAHVSEEAKLGWAERYPLVFSNARVEDALAEFNHRSSARIEFAGAKTVHDTRVSGIFYVSDPEFFAQTIADRSSAPLIVHRFTQNGSPATSHAVRPRAPDDAGTNTHARPEFETPRASSTQ